MNAQSIRDPLVARLAAFLDGIGLAVRSGEIPEKTFLPGIAILNGVLTFDEAKLLYPGDLLHEAGHLAILAPADRQSACGHIGDDGGMEMAAIAWSYAAARHLGIPPETVFHDAGYRGGAGALVENFNAGRGVGVPMLEWMGLAAGDKLARCLGLQAYPAMLRWLREQ